MAIENKKLICRQGLSSALVKSKLLPGEFAVTTDDKKLYICLAAGNVQNVATTEQLANILNVSTVAYSAMLTLLETLDDNPSQLTSILNAISNLQDDISAAENGIADNASAIQQNSSAIGHANASIGNVASDIADVYNHTSTYAVGDLCIYDNVLHKCNTAIPTGGEAWTEEHWTEVKVSDILKLITSEIKSLNNDLRITPFTASSGVDNTTDWNSINTAGLNGKILGPGNANAPSQTDMYYCIVIRFTNLAYTQIAIPYSTLIVNTKLFVRTYYSGTYSSWVDISKGTCERKYTETAEVSTLGVTTNGDANSHKVLYSIKIDNLKPSDIIDLSAQCQITNGLSYNVGVSRFLVATSSATATTGALVVGGKAAMSNVTPSEHHGIFNIIASDTGRTGTVYYNLVSYAVADGAVSGDTVTVEPTGGNLIATVRH